MKKTSAKKKSTVPRKRAPLWKRLLIGLLITGFSGAALAIAGFWGVVFYLDSQTPTILTEDDYWRMAKQSSQIFSADNRLIGEFFIERRTLVSGKQIPKVVKQAITSAEDARFYQHEGLDWFGLARAFWATLRKQRFTQGGSTITMQVARTFYLTKRKKISRKLKEIVLARKLERRLGKDTILFLYLNQIYFGHGRYGIQEATRFFFSKDVQQIKPVEAALLAGLVQSPERLSPIRHPKRALARRAYVLRRMAENGFLTEADAIKLSQQPLALKVAKAPDDVAPYFVQAVVRKLVSQHGKRAVYEGGLKVYTTLDIKAQLAARKSLKEGLQRVDKKFGFIKPLKRLGNAEIRPTLARFAQWYRKKLGKTLGSGRILRGVVLGRTADNKGYRVSIGILSGTLPDENLARYVSEKSPAKTLYSRGDVLRVSTIQPVRLSRIETVVFKPENGPQAALVAIDPHTRFVRALVGGYDFKLYAFNRGWQAYRQAGSTFKPIVYAAALESGKLKTDSIFHNVPETYRLSRRKSWKPKNFNGRYDGKPYTMAQALMKSINVIAVSILDRIGVDPAIRFARKIGIQSPLNRDLTLVLGASSVSPLELVNAYATFASYGMYRNPILINRLIDGRGRLLLKNHPPAKRVISELLARQMTSMMHLVVERGTGRAARKLGRPAAGKTGTSNKSRNNWFVGYTPQLVCGVWVGFDDRRPIRRGTGGGIAAPIWTSFMKSALEGKPMLTFRFTNLPRPRVDDPNRRKTQTTPRDLDSLLEDQLN